MMRNKFVSAAKPTDYADQLHVLQRRIEKMAAELKKMEADEKHLQNYLLRFSKGESFLYAGKDGFEKKVKVGIHTRLILDCDKVRKLLKARTPYKASEWTTIKVDWVRE